LTSQSPPQLAVLARWLLALLLVALLVWWVGRRIDRGPRPEIGVTGERDVPLVVVPQPTPPDPAVVERAEPAPQAEPLVPAAPSRREPEPVPVSPSPR
jgi:hypothetical protein